jgi:hypothetical protein
MSLAKRAQNWIDPEIADASDVGDEVLAEFENLFSDISVEEEEGSEDVEAEGPEFEGEVTIQVGEDDPKEFSFSLPKVPGSDVEDDIEEITVEEPEDEVVVEEQDTWDYGVLTNFLPWLAKMIQNVPGHNGYDTSGLERAISYLGALNKSISRAVRSDLKNTLDIPQIEKARKEIEEGIMRLEERLERQTMNKKRNKKKSDSEYAGELIKEAQKISGVQGRIVVTVPLIISRVARVCINGMVSAGHDIEDLFDRQVKKYNFDIQQQAELMQLLEDMGYPLRRDRGFLRDEEIDITRSDNFDWAANYPENGTK